MLLTCIVVSIFLFLVNIKQKEASPLPNILNINGIIESSVHTYSHSHTQPHMGNFPIHPHFFNVNKASFFHSEASSL